MKNKISKMLGVALTVTLLVSLAIGIFAAPAAAAVPGVWEQFQHPRPGALSDYQLVPVTAGGASTWLGGPGPVAKAIDGSLYAYWRVGDPTNLYKSTDFGKTWNDVGLPVGPLAGVFPLVDIACSTDDADLVYVASATTVYKSTNGGRTWVALTAVGMSGTETITSLDVGYNGGSHWVVVGTTNTAAADGEVYLREDAFGGSWVAQLLPGSQTAAGDYDVFDVACSPNFDTEATPQIVAVVSSAANTYVTYQYGGGAWNDPSSRDAELQFDPTPTSFGAIDAADIAFPTEGYDSQYSNVSLVVAIDESTGAVGGGDIYMVYGGTAYDQDIAAPSSATDIFDVELVGAAGSAYFLAAQSQTRTVWRSDDGGATFDRSAKNPSGGNAAGVSAAYVVLADDFADSGQALVAKAGAAADGQSAISETMDFGKTFVQISMIDTEIDIILTMDFSPAYDSDSTMFFISGSATAGVTSLWRANGNTFVRVLDDVTATDTFAAMNSILSVKVSPEFASDETVFIADPLGLKIWRATDGGSWFRPQIGAPANFAGSWLVIDRDTLVVGEAIPPPGGIQFTTNNGTTWNTRGVTGIAGPPQSFALSPDYDSDSTLLLGDTAGGVFMSTNAANSWEQVPSGVGIASMNPAYVAFDADFSNNDTIYAACNAFTPWNVHRHVLGDTAWDGIDITVTPTNWPGASTALVAPAGNLANPGIVCAPDGALYVADVGVPVLRSINPTLPFYIPRGPYFEPMATAYTAATSTGVWYTPGSNTLWTLTSAAAGASVISNYGDFLTVAPVLKGPSDGSSTGRTLEVSLSWDSLVSSNYYFVWVSHDPSFATSALSPALAGAPFNVVSGTPAMRVTGLEPGRTYYWKVCAADSVAGNGVVVGKSLSPWSDTWSFTTGLGAPQWNPFVGGVPESPYNGATNVSLTPSFAWNPADWATGYEFVLAKDAAFSDVVISKTGANALTATVYLCEQTLDYGTTYYWKVCATSKTSASEWATAVFTTEAAPAPTPTPPPTPTPAPEAEPLIDPVYLWVIIGIGAVLVIALIILIVRTRRVS